MREKMTKRIINIDLNKDEINEIKNEVLRMEFNISFFENLVENIRLKKNFTRQDISEILENMEYINKQMPIFCELKQMLILL